MEQLGYVAREADATDARRKRIAVTPHGHALMEIGGALFDDVRARWAARIGEHELHQLETHLGQLVERRTFGADDLARDVT